MRHLHCAALKWPVDKIDVRGVDPPDSDPDPLDTHVQGVEGAQGTGTGTGTGMKSEMTNRMLWEDGERRACQEWEKDSYGVNLNKNGLGAKRRKRGWVEDNKGVVVWKGEGEVVRELLEWKGGEDGREVFPWRLPWEEEQEQE